MSIMLLPFSADLFEQLAVTSTMLKHEMMHKRFGPNETELSHRSGSEAALQLKTL